MEFSILIPVFNTDIRPLCQALSTQASALSTNFQILFIDDCSELSTSYLNQKVKSIPHVEYEVLSTNIGRAAIRNLLFNKAQFENCIIMDGDVRIIADDYIEKYLQQIQEGQLVVGGHTYQSAPPEDKDKLLHWTYGNLVESKKLNQRSLHPYQSFMSSNFACCKSTFEALKFDENIQGYGHEDTLFGINAKQKNISIKHIDNPVRHEGLDSTADFLNKQHHAVLNLKKLYKNPLYKQEMKAHSSLIKLANSPLPFILLKIFKPQILKNLRSENPRVKSLQMLKLLWWRYG